MHRGIESEVRLIDHKNGLMAVGQRPRNSIARKWALIQAGILKLTKFAVIVYGNGLRIKTRYKADAQGNFRVINFKLDRI